MCRGGIEWCSISRRGWGVGGGSMCWAGAWGGVSMCLAGAWGGELWVVHARALVDMLDLL